MSQRSRNAAASAATAARRTAAVAHLKPWVDLSAPVPASASGAVLESGLSFKPLAKVAAYSLRHHGWVLGDTGPLPKTAVAEVASRALRAVPEDRRLTFVCDAIRDAFRTLPVSPDGAWINLLCGALAADGPFSAPLATAPAAPARQTAISKAAPPVEVAITPEVLAANAQDTLAAIRAVGEAVGLPSVLEDALVSIAAHSAAVAPPPPIVIPVADLPADVVAGLSQPGGPLASPVVPPLAASVEPPVQPVASVEVVPPVAEPVAEPVAPVKQVKLRAGKVPAKDTPEWQEAARRCTALAARPDANWQPASVVFGVKGLKGYVEVVNSSHPNVPSVDSGYVFNRAILERAIAALSGAQGAVPIHLWFWGERGTGKTTLVEQMAARLGRPFFKVTFTRFTDASEIIGQTGLVNGNTVWTDGSITAALRCHDAPIVLFDEFSLAQSGNVSGPINEIVHPLCKYHIPQTGEVIRFDPRTWFLVADNTNGSGDSTGRYTDTRQANRATVDRFGLFCRINRLSDSEEVQLIVNRAGVDFALATRTQGILKVLREKCDNGTLADPPSMREAIAFAAAMRSGLLKPEDAFESAFAGKYPVEAQEEMRSTFTATWKASEDETAIVSHPLEQHVEPAE